MKIKDVAKLSPEERFLYWIRERHAIYLNRKAGKPKPWTDDEVLQSYFFTNPYRENDKTTVWFRRNIRESLRDDPRVLMATVIFRWFNRISTGKALCGSKGKRGNLTLNWDNNAAQERLGRLRDTRQPLFTGAYMIKAGNGPSGCKLGGVCTAIDNVWAERKRLVQVCLDDCRLQALWQELKQFPFLGGFMSYEIACDLRYTYLLENATDIDEWCNPGPGAKHGFNRLQEESLKNPIPKEVWVRETSRLLKVVRRLRLRPRMEMREVEHSLCEWDKYERARTGQGGRMKRKFDGGSK